MDTALIYDINAPKRPSNLSVNSSLLAEARKYKVNLSGLLEQALIETLKEKNRLSGWKKIVMPLRHTIDELRNVESLVMA